MKHFHQRNTNKDIDCL